jgi:hypothetical protein
LARLLKKFVVLFFTTSCLVATIVGTPSRVSSVESAGYHGNLVPLLKRLITG